MAKIINPFIVTGKIEPEYFCDRVTESARLVKSITNGNNLVIISPRRMGKTGLIRFCYDKPEISKEYYTFFIDILHTSSLREFTYLLGREIYETLLPRSRKMANLFIQTIKSISGKFGFDPISGTPTFNVELGDIDRPEYTLEEIFRYLANADKPCIVAIDEFQQIAKYPEKNIEALLRTHIQKLRNSNFIFAGSERHMMQEMFTSAARPFYHSADMLELKAIVPEIYIPFIVGHFEKRNRHIATENIEKVYHLFKGHTYYIQKTFNEAFADTPEEEECTLETIQAAIDNMIAANDTIFREILSNIPEKQKELLYAIAKDGEAERITSSEFIKRHSLTSASSVQSASKKLLDKDIITEINKAFSVTDKLFAMWINQLYGNNKNTL
ncbi:MULTISPECIES: AAA family ATPase [Odoribacteraceae]|uniref:AAA family ATPase n=1 Tax=Odoribacteraceae TaxID=1853231 RepID=UPI000E52841C|nr:MULTISPECIES: ATP-binding protein [Odoribacteraceae]MCQ4874621.1 ATP-binding protein [Butyricimonas paravirosa]RHR76108.1 ATP-binding protein [Odoribacter sp. AF15-53]